MDGGCDPAGNKWEDGGRNNHFSVMMKFSQQSTTKTMAWICFEHMKRLNKIFLDNTFWMTSLFFKTDINFYG